MKKLSIIKLIASSLCIVSIIGAYFYTNINSKDKQTSNDSYLSNIETPLETNDTVANEITNEIKPSSSAELNSDCNSTTEIKPQKTSITKGKSILPVNTNIKPSNPIKVENNKPEETKPTAVTATQIGFINNISENNGNIYIYFDKAEFFTGEAAKQEIIKDNAIEKLDPNGAVYDDYYLRNTSINNKTYKLSPNITTSLCKYTISANGRSADLIPTSLNTFKNYVNSKLSANAYGRPLLFWIDYSDDTIINIRMQYTP